MPLTIRVNNQIAGRIDQVKNNSFFGYLAGLNITTGTDNTGNGMNALSYNANGCYNSAYGASALFYNTSGYNNSAFGQGALNLNYSGTGNSAFGMEALVSNSTGNYNTAAGQNCMTSNTIGYENTAYGATALFSNVAGNFATAIGYNAMQYSNNQTTAFSNYNVALGYEALCGSTTAANNTGNYNTALGSKSLWSYTTGSNNTTLGYKSGYTNSTGSGNVFLGYQAGYNETGSNKLYIANSNANPPLIYGDFSNGKIGLGTISPAAQVDIVSNSSSSTPQLRLFENENDFARLTLANSSDVSFWSIAGLISATHANSRLNFYNSATGDVMSITGDSKVGIGTTNPTSKLSVSGGDINILDIGSGIIMKSPDGQCWKVTIDDSGTLQRTSIPCP